MNDKFLQAKRNHHYVWAHHLSRWSNDGRNVWHTTPKGKIVLDSIRGLAKEEYFYRSSELSAGELHLIRRISSYSPDHLQKIHNKFLEDFLRIQDLGELYRESGIDSSEIERALNAIKCNMLEDIHADYERRARPIIDSLIDGNLSLIYDDSNFIELHDFIGHQISRTKRFKDTLYFAFSSASQSIQVEDRINQERFACWWFLSFMFGLNIGWSLFSSRSSDKHCLLINESSTDFITGDQPVVNVHPKLREGDIAPPESDICDFYYPISPRVAYMINKSDRLNSGITYIKEDIVHDLNTKIAKSSQTHIIGTDSRTSTPPSVI
jgi:hypothetical protein